MLSILGRIFGRNGNGRHEALAHVPDDGTPTPPIGSLLNQFFGDSKIMGEAVKLLGVFNPRQVGTRTRLLMRCDPDVAFGLAILRAPIINMNWSVESNDPEIAAFVKAALRPVYRKLATGQSMALHFGRQLSEKVWETGPFTVIDQSDVTGEKTTKTYPAAWTYHDFKSIDPRSYVVLIDKENDTFGGVKQNLSKTGNINPEPVGPEKVVLWAFRKEEVWGHLDGFPISDQCYEPWWAKAATNLFANRYFERKADPAYKALADSQIQGANGVKMDGFQFIMSAILGLKGGGVIALPNKRDQMGNLLFDVAPLTDDKRGDMFQQRLDALSQQILRGLWITDKAGTSDGTGSLAMAEVHAETMSSMMQGILNEWLDDVVNPQVVNPLVLYNFGPEALKNSQTRLVSGGLSATTKELFKTLLVQLLQAEQLTEGGGVVTLAERIDGVNLLQQLGIALRSPEELEEISRQKAARRPELPGAPPREDGEEPNDEEIADELVKTGVMEGDEVE